MHPFETLEVPPKSVGIHWFGQSSFGIKDPSGMIFMVDPYFPRIRPPENFIHAQPPVDEKDLKTDSVLLTHDHGDHTCPESLNRIHAAFPTARFYGPRESISRLLALGIPVKQLTVMTAGDVYQAGNNFIHAVFSKPAVGIPEDGIQPPDVEHLGYVLETEPVRVYISGDLVHTFARHAALTNPVLELKPDIGLLTTHPTEGEFPDFRESIEMALKIGLKSAVPAHYDCFIKRTFDPSVWAAGFPQSDPQPLIIGYNQSIVFSPNTG
jgi:L-ascorbate metabolism protein UlaG (beta-lactamase superfamily)